MQSQTAADFINCTTSASVVTTPSQFVAKKTDSTATSIGKWEATGSLVEPLQIHLPVTPTITSYSTTAAIKSENISSGSSSSSNSSKATSKRSSKSAKQNNKNINDCILNLHHQHQNKTETKSDGAGCSRTLPLAWNTAIQHLQQTHVNNNVNCETATLLQIKREPCQVSEVTTSNNLLTQTSFSGSPAIIKIEQKSPTNTTSSAATFTSFSASMDGVTNNSGLQHNNGKIKI